MLVDKSKQSFFFFQLKKDKKRPGLLFFDILLKNYPRYLSLELILLYLGKNSCKKGSETENLTFLTCCSPN